MQSVIINLMKKFREFSSLTINVEKREASWIGRAKNRTSKPIRCKWSSLTKSCIKILGIHFSYNKALAEKENFYSLSLDCCALLNIRKQSWSFLAGKIQVLKSLVASKAVYVAIITPYNVGSVLWRLFSTLEVVQYIGGITSVLWGDSFSTVGG